MFYRGFTELLPSNATFAVARAATIQAARDLYGAGAQRGTRRHRSLDRRGGELMGATNRRIMPTLVALLTLASPAAAQSPHRAVLGRRERRRARHVERLQRRFDFASQFQDQERSTASVDYPVKGGPLVDGTFAVRLWKGFAVGIGVSHFSKRSDATVNAQVAHPFQFNQFRSIEGSTSTCGRRPVYTCSSNTCSRSAIVSG